MTQPSKELPLPGEVFSLAGCTAFFIPPTTTDAPTSWVWYAPTLANLPGPEEVWMLERFGAAGLAVAGIDVGESYGSPKGRALYTALYKEMTQRRGMASRPCLLARSRGGLMLYNWVVENAEKVGGIAGIYPVCNLRSYPGIERACPAYEMTAEELVARLSQHNPLDRLAPLAQAGVSIFHIHGDCDEVVPLEDNSGALAQRYEKLGGEITLQVVEGGGHTMWEGWFQCRELVEFVVGRAGRNGPRTLS
ncbi:MAG: alpha/beta hydrolase [Candidatus Latescibacteria bacterium]|nr:alpha/beta hydrolase [Candidatus Latescibacterota bacterium]